MVIDEQLALASEERLASRVSGTCLQVACGKRGTERCKVRKNSNIGKAPLRSSCLRFAVELCLKFKRCFVEPLRLIGRLKHLSKHAYMMEAHAKGSRHNGAETSGRANPPRWSKICSNLDPWKLRFITRSTDLTSFVNEPPPFSRSHPLSFSRGRKTFLTCSFTTYCHTDVDTTRYEQVDFTTICWFWNRCVKRFIEE